MDRQEIVRKLIQSRAGLAPEGGFQLPKNDREAEGGCGVIGMASDQQIAARHMLRSLEQMRNRGNGKGGGIAAAGLAPEEFGVTKDVLQNDYLLAVAYLDLAVREEIEREYIHAPFKVDHVHEQAQLKDYRRIEGLEVQPPEVVCYFVRPKKDVLDAFRKEQQMEALPNRTVEDEFVYQNTFKLNTAYYASLGEKQAFVLSHGKNLLVLKMVGYGDDVIRYYQIEDMHAHVWIGHHRYPTKGRVWHPGGAHPFIGLNEALVHNGDFANHASISEYLAQRNIFPLFLTDTEVAVQVFDLLHRTYDYPLEYVIESMAPTTERDFTLLPPEKQHLYQMLQTTHIHASPDGPWFFLIAQSDVQPKESIYRLTGITDTSMLRPQVFAWQGVGEDDVSEKASIGFAASEKQAIDAALESLATEDSRFWTRADCYWNARGGSHTDGGAFLFSVHEDEKKTKLTLTDKFGEPLALATRAPAYSPNGKRANGHLETFPDLFGEDMFDWVIGQLQKWGYKEVTAFLENVEQQATTTRQYRHAIDLLTKLMDRRYPTGNLRRSSLLSLYDQCLADVFAAIEKSPSENYVMHKAGDGLPEPASASQTVILDARGYAAEGEQSPSRELQRLYKQGFCKFIVAHAKGQRFIGNGLGAKTKGVEIDVYGSSGDYLASGIDGAGIHVHNNGQDQLAQIMKSGKLVVYGDLGQTFMYGAKGGEAYVLGNAAGRPLINAVGKPRVVINGTCLDYLAESFMAGDPLNGGGFVILNAITFDEEGAIIDLPEPYPGGNLFSLASGGALYIRDPQRRLSGEQLNGGEFVPLSDADWALFEPYLRENERLFAVPVERLLTVEGKIVSPSEVYRKVQPRAVRALQAEEAWVTKGAH